MQPPHPNTYWVRSGIFLAGEYPRALHHEESLEKLRLLIIAGITDFIDLTTPEDGLMPYEDLLLLVGDERTRYHRFPIPDLGVPHSDVETVRILDTIDALLDSGRAVYLHCWGGIGRTGTIVGCWLARHDPMRDPLLALRDVWKANRKSHYTESPETEAQRRYIRQWRDRDPHSSSLSP